MLGLTEPEFEYTDKATFLTAPNRMDPKEVVRLLKDAQKRRVNPQLIVEWNTACKSYSEKRKWFG